MSWSHLKIYMNYEHDQERLLSTASHAISSAVSTGAQLWANRQKTVKVEIKTAAQDVQAAQNAIQQGTPKQEILNSLRQGEVYQRVAKAGGDPHKYEQLVLQRAEIEHAVKMMPAQSPAHLKTTKKTLS